MTETVDRGRTEDTVREVIGPFWDIEVGCDDGALALLALGDHVMAVLVLGSFEGFETEVVDDEKIDCVKLGSAYQSGWLSALR